MNKVTVKCLVGILLNSNLVSVFEVTQILDYIVMTKCKRN